MISHIKRLFLVPFCLSLASAAGAAPMPRPLDVVETADAITVTTDAWKLVFDRAFNGGPSQWYDHGFDPGELDNLATSQGGNYSNGVLFDYDVYLGTYGGNAIEHMTTQGRNADPGALELMLIESSPARVRIRQHGHPRLNNGGGPPGDPFRELALITFTTLWTIYPTGKVHIDFQTEVNPEGMVVDSGPGGAGKSISSSGTTITATGGTNFLNSGVWAGDTIESAAGAWGPVLVLARNSPSQLTIDQSVPSGSNLSFVVRRTDIVMETISIHADGDASHVNQCSGPAQPTWHGGSNGDPLWTVPDFSACRGLMRNQGGGYPPLANDTLLVHWARQRYAGSLLAFFEPWVGIGFGSFNDEGFTDISYTQLGRFGRRPAEAHHRHFLAQLGSAYSASVPTVRSVANAQPFADDYQRPFAEALVGSLAAGPEIASYGFDLSTGAYRITSSACTPAATCRQAVIRFDSSAGIRSETDYRSPAIELNGFDLPLPAGDADVRVELSHDAGASFVPLDPSEFNLTDATHETQLGSGNRLFQLLATIAGSGATAHALRFKATSQCTPSPRAGCSSAGKSSFLLKLPPQSARHKLSWKWSGTSVTNQSGFGDPRLDTDASLCVYAGAAQQLVLEASVAPNGLCAGRACWRTVGSRGYKYRFTKGNADGIKSVRLLSHPANKSRVSFTAGGDDLDSPILPMAPAFDVVVQAANSDTSNCWESVFPAASFRSNTQQKFKATLH